MNKNLMALAVAGALTAPGLAVAQVGSSPGVTLYGRIDSAIMLNTYSAVSNAAGVETVSELKKGDIFQAGNAMGVRGREDLGGGTAVWFQLETGVWTERLDTGTTTGNNWGGRNSALGVSSGLGDIMYGMWDNPYKVSWGAGNVVAAGPFGQPGIIIGAGDTTGALPNAKCSATVNNGTGALATLPVCATEVTAGTTQWSRRTSNSVQWWSPTMAGLQVRLMTAVANYQSASSATVATQAGTQKPKTWSGSVQWASGPVTVAGGFESHEGFRQGGAGGVANPKDTAVAVSAKWNFGVAQIGAIVEQLKYANTAASGAADTGMKLSNTMLNGSVRVGPGAIWASYSTTPGGKSCTAGTVLAPAACGSLGEAKMLSLGYDYVMSKRTKMYFGYTKIDNGGASTGGGSSYYYVAGPAANTTTAGGLTASTDVTTLSFGMQHTF